MPILWGAYSIAARILAVLAIVTALVAFGYVKGVSHQQLEDDAAARRASDAAAGALKAQVSRNNQILSDRERDRQASQQELDLALRQIREAHDACTDAAMPDAVFRVFALPARAAPG